MKDTVAEVVAERLQELMTTLQAMGLRRASIIAGLELGLKRLKDEDS
jgi:hypothetical protein